MAEQILFGIDVSGIDQSLGKELTKALMSDQNRLKSVFSAALADATKKGTEDGLEASKVEEYLGAAFSRGEATLAKAAALYAKASQTTDAAAKKSMMERAAAMRKAVEEETASRLKAQQEILSRHGKAIKQWEEFQSKSARDRLEMTSKGLQDAWSALKGGDAKGLSDMLSGALGLAQGAAARGGVTAAGGAAGTGGAASAASAAASLGSASAALAAVAIPLAVVAGTLALVVKLITDAVGQSKEFHKTLLQTAGAGDFMMGTMNDATGDFVEGLGVARRAATDFVFNVKWGTVADDLLKIQTAANDAGLTFREMQADTSELVNGMSGLTGHMELALRYSKLLGVSSTEVADQMGKWQTELGMGLKSLEERFSTITKLAMESGFGVKRFYTMVGQATTGVALYNVRIEEAAKLLKLTGEVLGESEAADFISTLQKGFAGDDYPTRLKRIMLTGMADTHRIVSKSAEETGKRFAQDFEGPLRNAFAGMEGMDGVNISAMMEGGGFVEQLGNMTQEQQRELLHELQNQGSEGQAAARQLQNVMDLATAAQSGSMNDMVGALDNLDMGGKLAMLLDSQILGNKRLSEMTELERHVFSQTQGLDVEMIEKLARMEQSLLADYEAQEDYNGTFSDYVQEFGYREEENIAALSQQEYLAQATVEATRDLGNIMENGVQYVLEKIFSLLEGAFQTIFGLSGEEQRAKQDAITAGEEQLALLVSSQERAEDELRAARQAEATATTQGEREDAQKRVGEALAAFEDASGAVDAQRQVIGEITALGSGGWREMFGDRDAETFTTMGAARARERYGAGEEMEDIAKALIETSGKGGEMEFRTSKGGTQGLITDTSTAMYHAGSSMMAGSSPGSTGNLLGAGMAAVGGLFSWASEADTAHARNVGEGEGLSKSLEAIAEREERIAEEQRADAANAERLSLEEQEAATEELQRLRRESPEHISEGMLRAQAEGLLIAAGGSYDSADVSALLGRGSREEIATIRSRTASALGTRAGTLEGGNAFLGEYINNVENAADDFIYRGGTLTPINSADQFFGAKPGGPIDQAVGNSGKVVHINIHGGDTQKIYQVVKQAMAASGR